MPVCVSMTPFMFVDCISLHIVSCVAFLLIQLAVSCVAFLLIQLAAGAEHQLSFNVVPYVLSLALVVSAILFKFVYSMRRHRSSIRPPVSVDLLRFVYVVICDY